MARSRSLSLLRALAAVAVLALLAAPALAADDVDALDADLLEAMSGGPAPVPAPVTTAPATGASAAPSTSTGAVEQPVPLPAPVPVPAGNPPAVIVPLPSPAPAAAPAPAAPAADPACSAVPGCLQCLPAKTTTAAGRKLKQADDLMGSKVLKGMTAAGKPTLDFSSFITSAYDNPNLPACTVCNTTGGYALSTKGRCSCMAGFGDLSPTGVCNRCPEGSISLGGFRAVCTECQNVAWSNSDNTACLCASGWYGSTNPYTKQATCNQCPGARPVSKDGSASSAECFSCPAGSKPNEIYSECVKLNTTATNGTKTSTTTTLADALAPSPSPAPAPPAPRIWNETQFANTRRDWTITTRATKNYTNPFTELIGGVMESMIMGKPITSTAATPGDLLYQVLTKPAPQAPKAVTNMAQLQANLNTLGANVQAIGNLINNVAGTGSNARTSSPASSSGSNAQLASLLGNVMKVVSNAAKATTTTKAAAPAAVKAPTSFITVPAAPPKATKAG